MQKEEVGWNRPSEADRQIHAITTRHLSPPFASLSAEAMTRISILLGVALVRPPIQAQPALSLREAVDIALAGNKAISASAASNDAAALRITQAKSGFLPKIDYSESWTRSDNPVFV